MPLVVSSHSRLVYNLADYSCQIRADLQYLAAILLFFWAQSAWPSSRMSTNTTSIGSQVSTHYSRPSPVTIKQTLDF